MSEMTCFANSTTEMQYKSSFPEQAFKCVSKADGFKGRRVLTDLIPPPGLGWGYFICLPPLQCSNRHGTMQRAESGILWEQGIERHCKIYKKKQETRNKGKAA